MKKLISLILVFVLCLTMCACGSDRTESEENATTKPEEVTVTEATEPEPVTFAPGEKVSTDLAEFTLERSQFTYYVSGKTADYMEPRDDGGFWAASVGYCYVHLVFTITSKDRGGSIDFGGKSYDTEWDPHFVVYYNGNEYGVNGYDIDHNEGRDYFNFGNATDIFNITTNKEEHIYGATYSLYAGSTVRFRTFGVIKLDPENLTDGFDISVQVPNSDGEYEVFTYRVPARQ